MDNARDLLTRTTLQLHGELPSGAQETLVAALQRVPGVLVAQIGPESARAVVAHDAGVRTSSLLAAAAKTGVRLTVVADTRKLVARAGQKHRGTTLLELAVLAAVLVFLPFLLTSINARSSTNHFLLPAVLSLVWAFVIVRAIVQRRK